MKNPEWKAGEVLIPRQYVAVARAQGVVGDAERNLAVRWAALQEAERILEGFQRELVELAGATGSGES